LKYYLEKDCEGRSKLKKRREFEDLSDLKPITDEEFEDLLNSMKDRRRRKR